MKVGSSIVTNVITPVSDTDNGGGYVNVGVESDRKSLKVQLSFDLKLKLLKDKVFFEKRKSTELSKLLSVRS